MQTGKHRATLWRQQNPEKAAKVRKNYYLNNTTKVLAANEKWKKEHPEYYLWHSARQRAKVKGLEFNIDLNDVIIPTHCPVLLVPLVWKDKEFAPSLDRIDNSKGYIKNNIQVISKKANRMKNNATEQELNNFCTWMMTHRKDLDDRYKQT